MIAELTQEMIAWFRGDPKRVQHFLKVWAFSKMIGESEGMSAHDQMVLEAAALTHDIGIRTGERLYNSSSGKYQEMLGPKDARPMLEKLDMAEADVERVCWLIGHHHTYGLDAGLDYQILLEADFLVNAYEDEMKPENVRVVKEKIFRTKLGSRMLGTMYPA